MPPLKKTKSLPWDTVEKAIAKETRWLETNISFPPFEDQSENLCKNCGLRRLAILIVSGKVKAREIKSKKPLFGTDDSTDIGKPHGKEWHTRMMKILSNYFSKQGYETIVEPRLNLGRADLMAHQKNKRSLIIEIGTIQLKKLLFNLESMEGFDFLLVSRLNSAIELSVVKANYPA